MFRIKYWLFSVILIASACNAGVTPTLSTNTQAVPQPSQANSTSPIETPTAQVGNSTTPEIVIPNTAETAASPAITCTPPASLTPSLTEGPYYSTGSPEAQDIGGNLPGTRLTLTGYVLDENCKPISGAWLDFWQADSQGNYDNQGYTLRGHQFTDENGKYSLVTVVPGLYPGRTEHIHVKVKAPDGPEVTTQLFFPGVTENSSDGIFDPSLILKITSDTGTELQAVYSFIVPAQ